MERDLAAVHEFTPAWSRDGPLKWLERLRQNPRTVFYVNHPADGWVREADLAGLVAAMGSVEPAGAVCFLASAHAVPAAFQSTVGREASRMLDAFRRNGRYPGTCSDLAVVDDDELKRWWKRRKP